ncbi:MAG TPA: Crp/Fnr family transcriptional regulator [Chitinophagaceae bacterium]|nr:Crp/Fnr family transcriptional regulator [Chitinophagaceae bacterium]
MDNFRALQEFLGRFMPLSGEDFAILKKKSSVIHIRKKDIITDAGDTELYLYFVVKGLIREYFYKGSQQVTTDLISEGTITGSVTSFFTGAPSHFCLQAMEPCSLIAIHKGALEDLYRSNRNWEKFGRIITTHFLLQQEKQILNYTRLNPRERFLHFVNEYSHLVQRVPQKYLASFLQIKPETFSRMKHLIRKNPKKQSVS